MELTSFVHIFIIPFVFSRGDVVQPLLVVEIPSNSLLNAFFKLEAWFPAEFALELGGVDGITGIVTEAVGDVGDEVEIFAFLTAKESVNGVDDNLDDVDVLPFVESSDVVGFSNGALVEDEVDGTGMVFHIKPVAYVLAFAIYRQRFAMADVIDEERNELLRELVWAVVVGAVGHDGGHAVGVVECAHEVVAAGFGCGVG